MKIPLSIRQIYNDQKDIFDHLKDEVDKRIENVKDSKWHYESRVKKLESFTLKLETGRIQDPRCLEDFFGCLLVVENIQSIIKAEKLIENEFQKQYRKPNQDQFTHKKSESFPFDDLRLYVKWKDDPTLPPSGLSELIFEVQIKTFLQHAWGIATHDFIYKTDKLEWGKERLAYQIKAMLEHAELSILEVNRLAESSVLDKTNRETRELSDIISMLRECWNKENLPNDIVRLSRNIRSLILMIDMNVKKLKEIIKKDTEKGNGTNSMSLSPYGVVLQTLINCEENLMLDFLTKNKSNFKLLIPDEIELPEVFKDKQLINAVFVSS